MQRAILSAILVVLTAATALAQKSDSSALINQQLDRQTRLQLSGTLPEAMSQIGKQTGVPVEADPAVWELLPWGRETAVTVVIENQTLRQALEAITRKLGLTFVLKDEAIELQPMPAVRRLGRKSTVTEVEALSTLSATPLNLKTDKIKFKELAEAVDLRLDSIKSPYSIENRTATSPDKVAQDTVLSIPRNATLLEALEAMTRQSSATWYPWGKTLVIIPKSDQIRRLLQKEVTLRHEGTDVAEVLSELSAKTGVPFKYEPGCLQALPPQVRKIRLVLNATAQDALESISGVTGLTYTVENEDVYIRNTNSPAAAPRERAVAIMPTESGLEILITESQCPEDIRQYIQFQKAKQFEKIRKMMEEQGFKPTPATRPTTQPASPSATEKPEPPGKDL